MNGRRRDRGETNIALLSAACVLCGIAVVAFFVIVNIGVQVDRIADAVCVEAPAALPAEEVPDGE